MSVWILEEARKLKAERAYAVAAGDGSTVSGDIIKRKRREFFDEIENEMRTLAGAFNAELRTDADLHLKPQTRPEGFLVERPDVGHIGIYQHQGTLRVVTTREGRSGTEIANDERFQIACDEGRLVLHVQGALRGPAEVAEVLLRRLFTAS